MKGHLEDLRQMWANRPVRILLLFAVPISITLIINVKYIVSSDYYFIYNQSTQFSTIPVYADASYGTPIYHLETYTPFKIVNSEKDRIGLHWQKIYMNKQYGYIQMVRSREAIIVPYKIIDVFTCFPMRILNKYILY